MNVAGIVRADRPTVIDETFDGEAVVVHLGTGRYYALNAAGTEVWELVRDGRTPSDASELIASARGEQAGAAAARFITDLLTEGLLVNGDGDLASAPAPEIEAGRWTDPPELQSFDDLRELLLLDPIHDVTLGPDGWPVAEK